MNDYPSAISEHSKIAVVVCATVNRRLSLNHECAVKHMIGSLLSFNVCRLRPLCERYVEKLNHVKCYFICLRKYSSRWHCAFMNFSALLLYVRIRVIFRNGQPKPSYVNRRRFHVVPQSVWRKHYNWYLDWKRSFEWLESWEGLLLVTDFSTTCAEAIFRVKW